MRIVRLRRLVAAFCVACSLIASSPCTTYARQRRTSARTRARRGTNPNAANALLVGKLTTGARVFAVRSGDGGWGVAVRDAGLSSATQPRPAQLEFYTSEEEISRAASGYETIERKPDGFTGFARVVRANDVAFEIQDTWSVAGATLHLSRKVTVRGDAAGGFLSGVTLANDAKLARADVDYFAPGMIYGSAAHLTAAAIGGSRTYEAQGGGVARIREDRLPAPLFGVRFADGSSLTTLDPAPRGDTTAADSQDTEAKTLIDGRFRFGSIGAEQTAGRLTTGFWFPGAEGEVTYKGDTYPGGQMRKWRRRYHPIKNGAAQEYRVAFRFARGQTFRAYYAAAWRDAWRTLKPRLMRQNIEVARRSLIDMLADRVETVDGRTGIPQFITAAPRGGEIRTDRRAVMGFVGKNLEAAEFLLKDAELRPSARSEEHRRKALLIFDSFTRLKMNPPAGEGFDLDTGAPAFFVDGTEKKVFLRSLTDDLKALMRAARFEQARGREHAEWLAWARGFADWLLTQQQSTGGFPRAWEPGTGRVSDASPQSTYNAVPFLVSLSQTTSEPRYMNAGVRAAEFAWRNTEAIKQFVGGTIDNPDVIDKEAGTLSTEAYLALYEATRDRKWLDRARAAADFAETWIYLWDVPMPADADALDWKRGVPTTGAQLISTGHSLVDCYMAFDVDEYAKLYEYTGDSHYLEVARLLLHDTKNMLAVPGRTYDLAGTGWQQEHWSFAPRRGRGLHRGWLPWVSTSHLNGIIGLEEFDPALYRELAGVATANMEPQTHDRLDVLVR